MFLTDAQKDIINSGMNQRKKVADALPMDSMGEIDINESPNTAKCVSLLFFNLAKYKPKDLVQMYNKAPKVIELSQQMMKDKGRTEENVTKNTNDPVGHIANVLDCFWFRPVRETAWDAPGQRLANPDEQIEHFMNYDPKQVQPAIGLLVSPKVVNADSDKAYIIADGGNGTVLNTLPGLIQGWVSTFFDLEKMNLKPNATFDKSEEWVTQQLTFNPVFVEVYLDHIGDCPKLCEEVENVERRVIEIFQKNNRGNKASIPNHINNIHMTKMEPNSYDRAIGDTLKNIFTSVNVTTGPVNDCAGGFSGDFEKLISVMMNNGMNFRWADVCVGMSAAVSKLRNEISGFNDMDPMIWNNLFQYVVSDYNVPGAELSLDDEALIDVLKEFTSIIEFYNKNGAFQGISGMVDVNKELPEGCTYVKGKQYDIAARVILELHNACYGEESWNKVFGVSGSINKNKLRTYQVTDANGNPYFHVLEEFSFYTGDKSKSYFFKDGKKVIGSIEQLAKIVNPKGVDKVKKDAEIAKRRAELERQLAQLAELEEA